MKHLLTLLALTSSAFCATPEVWISPSSVENGKAFRALFEHPDDWKDARSKVDVLFCTDLNLQRQFTDAELKAWFAQMAQWKLKLAMEVGAVKEWGLTGEKTFNAERKNWEHLQSLGANLYAIAMASFQRPLSTRATGLSSHRPRSGGVLPQGLRTPNRR
jgi:hypothetical protein